MNQSIFIIKVINDEKFKNAFKEIVVKELKVTRDMDGCIEVEKNNLMGKGRFIDKNDIDRHHNYSRTIFTYDKNKVSEYTEVLFSNAERYGNERRELLVKEIEAIDTGLQALSVVFDTN